MLDESAVSLTTTLKWPTLTAPLTSGPLNGKKDVNKGVITAETSLFAEYKVHVKYIIITP
jgi:hypothetical protein